MLSAHLTMNRLDCILMRLKHSSKSIMIAAILLLLSITPVIGEETNSITVTADSADGDNDYYDSSNVSRNTASEKNNTTISEEAGRSGGVTTNRSSSDESAISIRGSDPNQVSVQIDGIPVNAVIFGNSYLNDFSPTFFNDMEIFRSSTSFSNDLGAIGGSINLNTKNNIPLLGLTTGYGSQNTFNAAVGHGQKFKKLSYLQSLSFSKSTGQFEYTSDNGTPLTSTDDKDLTRGNNQLLKCSSQSALEYQTEKYGIFSANNIFSYRKGGLAGSMGYPLEDTSLDRMQNLAYLRHRISLPSTTIRTTAYYHAIAEKLRDPDNELSFSRNNLDSNTHNLGTINITESPLGKNNLLSTKIFLSYNGIFRTETKSGKSGEIPSDHRLTGQLSLADKIFLFKEKLIIEPSVTGYSWQNNFQLPESLNSYQSREKKYGYDYSFRLGTLYQIIEKKLVFRTNVGRGIRIPSFTELFGEQGTISGNTELKNEKSYNADMGFLGIWKHESKSRKIKSDIRAEGNIFTSHQYNLIMFINNSQQSMRAVNISEALIYGCELILTCNINDFIMKGNYTYQVARDKSDISYYKNKILPHRPLYQANLELGYNTKYITPSIILAYRGSIFRDRANSAFYFQKQRFILDSSINIKPYTGLQIITEIKNITNDRSVDFIGYPLPGREYYVSLKYQIDSKKKEIKNETTKL